MLCFVNDYDLFVCCALSFSSCLIAICNLGTNPNRVLYLAMSPDGQNIVTGAGDDSLRFWNVFPGPRTGIRLGPSSLTPSGKDIR
jgi:cell division cycle 20-like protein 1, cofactor of APC complex